MSSRYESVTAEDAVLKTPEPPSVRGPFLRPAAIGLKVLPSNSVQKAIGG
jgi:hypothetical protein